MRRPMVALVIGLSVGGSSAAAPGRTLAPGCLPDGAQGLREVSVRFGGLAASEGVARFYEHLRVRGALPCRRIVLDEAQPTLSHALMAAEHRATPPPYPATMDALICRLNARDCSKGRPAGTTFVVPDVHLDTHFPVWTRLPLDPDEDPDKDLEGVFARHHYSLPEKVDQDEWRGKIRKANLGFERWVTRGVRSKSGARLKQRQLLVPITQYRGTVSLPESVAETPGKAFDIPDFSLDSFTPLRPSGRTNGTATGVPLAARFDAALSMISMPPTLPRAGGDPATILIADRGIDAESLFLRPDQDVPADILAAATTGDSACNAKAHGTHVWGIIAGRVPDIMRGVALDGPVSPEIRFWDFDKQQPGGSHDFFDFVNEWVSEARVANLSIDFERDLSRSQGDRFIELVQNTPSILYVVAAENRLTKYGRTTRLSLPVFLHGEQNVVVVTALNESGTGVWDNAARNQSETDGVVLLAAPGVGIPSACAGNRVGILDGTSQATAFVSGAAALLVRDGLDDSLRVKRRLAYTADVLPGLLDGVAGGRLNVGRALGVKDDKLCMFANGDGIRCDAWTRGVAHLGYKTGVEFKLAKTIVLKGTAGQILAEVRPASRLLRVARQEGEGFAVFFLDRDEAMPDRLRRKRVAALEAFSDQDHHGSVVIRFDGDDGIANDVELEMLGDFVRRGT